MIKLVNSGSRGVNQRATCLGLQMRLGKEEKQSSYLLQMHMFEYLREAENHGLWQNSVELC